MRTLFLGDIHGNEDALDACLREIDRLRADAVCVLGDLVGWLPWGDRTFQRLQECGFPTVAGNHDLMAAGVFIDHPTQLDRMQATAFNAGRLSLLPGALETLAGLPLRLVLGDWEVVHHSPFHLPAPGDPPTIEHFGYLDEKALAEVLPAWSAHPHRLIMSGHDHQPAVFELPPTDGSPRIEDILVYRPAAQESLTTVLRPASKYWIKAGSVGGPYRDGAPIANMVLHDADAGTVTLLRIPYPTARLHRELNEHPFFRNLPTLGRLAELLKSEVPDHRVSPSCQAHGVKCEKSRGGE